MSGEREEFAGYAASDLGTYDRCMPWLIALVGAVFGYALMAAHGGLMADEGFHAPQVWGFYHKDYSISKYITVLPTYHYVLAFIVRQIGFYHDNLLRFVSLFIGLLSLSFVYGLVASHYPREAGMRMLQFFFLPLLFPFFFLIYTDAWTLTALAGMLFCVVRRRFLLAAVCGFIAVALRQTAVLWVGFAFLLICCDRLDTRWWTQWSVLLRNFLVKGFGFLLVFAAFGVFVYLNKGIAVGDKSQHEVALNLTNLYFFLLCAWVLFLPLAIQSIPDILVLLRRPWVLLLLALGLLLLLGTYKNTHQYNSAGLDFYLHNRVLAVTTNSLIARALLYVPVAWIVLTFVVARLPERRLYWLYPMIALSVVVHPLIEQRYYYPGLMFLLVWRAPCRPGAEVATLVFYVFGAAVLAFGSFSLKFFL